MRRRRRSRTRDKARRHRRAVAYQQGMRRIMSLGRAALVRAWDTSE